MTQEELINVFKYIVKKCDMLINNSNYEADAHTQNTVEDIGELCNHILDGDYGKLVEAKEVQEEPANEELEEAAVKAFKQIVDSDKNNFLEIFKAGAEWKKQQMMKDAIDATVFCESLKIPTIGHFLHETNLKENDKVKVIIIKSE